MKTVMSDVSLQMYASMLDYRNRLFDSLQADLGVKIEQPQGSPRVVVISAPSDVLAVARELLESVRLAGEVFVYKEKENS